MMKLNLKFTSIFLTLAIFVITNCSAQMWRGKKVKTTEEFQYVGNYFEGLAKVKQEGKWGYIDTLGRLVIKPKYEQVENFNEGLAKVRKSHRWGLINNKGEQVLEPLFDFIGDFVNDEALVRSLGKEAYIDRKGQITRKK